MVDELTSWLRIPSISSGDPDPQALQQAAEWVCERIEHAGGSASLVTGYGNPLATGELRANKDAPTVLIYGHYDVQDPGDLSLWDSDPFEPVTRDGRIYARGASDDKGNFLPLLTAACERARQGELPVNVRILVEGDEETGGPGASRWVAQDEGPVDCAIVYDSWMLDERTPALTLGLRGVVLAHITVRTGDRDLHSGVYGGSVLNAAHVLHAMLSEITPGPDGTLRDELRAGIAPSHADATGLPPGQAVLDEAGARPLHARAGEDYYARTWADTSLDVNELRAGAARTIVPAEAHATVAQRLAPNQSSTHIAETMERLLRAALPPGAEAEIRFDLADPVLFEPDAPAFRLAIEATKRATGTEPRLMRWGGSIPIVGALAARGVPVIASGFALPSDAPHAPNESYRLESLRLGEATAHELFTAFARLP